MLTSARLCRFGISLWLLAQLCFAGPAQAQTSAAWRNAATIGTTAFSSMATDATGNTYAVGNFSGSTVLGGTALVSQTARDGFLAKFTSTGQLAWVRQFGSGAGAVELQHVAVDAAGNAYISGNFPTAGTVDLGNNVMLTPGVITVQAKSLAFLARYSPQGLAQWAQQSNSSIYSNAWASGIGLDAHGNVYLAGRYHAAMGFGTFNFTDVPNKGTYATYLARFTAATGAVQFAGQVCFFAPGTGGGPQSQHPGLAVAPDGAAYVFCAPGVSATYQPATGRLVTLPVRYGSTDGLVFRLSSQGVPEWVQQFGSPGNDECNAGAADAAGNLYLGGSFTGPGTFSSTVLLPNAGLADAYLLKYSSTGVVQWVQAGGGSGADSWQDLALDAAGNPCVLGSFSAAAQYGAQTLTSAGLRDVAVAVYSAQRQLLGLAQAGGPGTDLGQHLQLDAADNLYAVGRFEASCHFGSYVLDSPGEAATFLAAPTPRPRALAAAAPQLVSLACFPNPATEQLYLPALPVGTPVEFVDARGRLARTSVMTAAAVSVRGLAPGLYTLRAADRQGRRYSGRVAVQ